MPISRDDFRCYDPVVLKKVAQIFKQADAVFLLALKSGADLALREWKPIEEERQILALANEFGHDAVLAALREVKKIRRETFEEVFGEVRRKRSPSDQMTRAIRDELAKLDRYRARNANFVLV